MARNHWPVKAKIHLVSYFVRTKEDVRRLREWLVSEGWSPRDPAPLAETCSQVWTKIFPGAECSRNKRGGAPVQLNLHDTDQVRDVELEIRAQKSDGVWVSLLFYSMPAISLVTMVEEQVPKLVKLWNSAAGLVDP